MKSAPNRDARAKLSRIAIFASSIVCAMWMHAACALITVGPDADAACQFHDVTSAIIHADQQPGVDVVAIVGGTYTGVSTATVTSTDDLIVEGGYASCSAGIPSGVAT